jgi:amidase
VDGLKGTRIGVARNMLGSDKRVIAIVESSIQLMNELGAVIVDPANLPNWDSFGETEIEVLCYEFKSDLNRYLASLGPRSMVHSLEDVIRFNEENKSRVMPYFGQERMTEAQSKGPLSSKAYRKALARNHRLTRKEGIDALISKKRLDAIVVASGGPAWTIDLANGDPKSWDMESTSPAAVAGYPHITVPAGSIFGLPVGVSFFAKAWHEPTLLRIAYAFEQARQARKPPQFLPAAAM